MSAEPLINYLSLITELSPAFSDQLEKLFEKEHYRPHQILHSAGQMENRLWFIDNGFARAYYFDKSGKEHTLNFYDSKDLIFSYQGLWKESSDYYIEILQDSELWSIQYDQVKLWIDKFSEMKIITNVLTRHRYHQELFRSRLLTWNAEERYLQFRKVSPDTFKKASVRLIATYLNMTRENLSRLMSRES